MAKLGYQSVSGEYEAPSEFGPLPAGDYHAQVIESSVVDTKSGGAMCKLKWQVISGPHEGRLVFSQHNTFNENEQAALIGRGELQGFADAMGVGAFDDSEQLHNKPVTIHVGIKHDKSGQYGPQNIVRRASPMNGAGAATTAKKPASQNSSATAQRSTPPHVAAQANGSARGTGATHGGSRGMGGRPGGSPFAD